MFVKKIKIGNVELKNNIFLAPMAGITDRAFRIVCEKFEPGLVYTEMISSKGLFHNDSKTKLLLNMEDEKRPIAVQIFGSDVESMKYAAEYVSKYADIIDINMGCPAPKVVKNGDGSKLLLDLPKAYEIIKEVVKSVSIPVTVKFRKGWDNDNIVAIDMAKIAEDADISKKSAEAALNAFINAVETALKKGDKVQLVGFGSFEVRKRAPRKGRNPQTKEEIKIPASKAPVFKAGKPLKDLVNKK